jgi:hypothetical protein
MRFILPALTLAVYLTSTLSASQIQRITLAELESKADYIVLGKVTKVVLDGDQDQVTIQVASYLKGKSKHDAFSFTLVTRGGLKDFDPALKEGASGVFFLKATGKPSEATKAYWGSIATFPQDHFDLAQKQSPAAPEDSVRGLNSIRGSLDMKAVLGEPTSVAQGMSRKEVLSALEKDGYPIDEIKDRRANTWHLRKSSAPGSPIVGNVFNVWVVFKKGVVESVDEGIISN